MSAEFLSICIPTRNRSALLRDLLTSLRDEIRAHQLTPQDLRIHLSDNASTDATPAVVREVFPDDTFLVYDRNPSNIGAMYNALKCCHTGSGDYRWLIGDDEMLAPGSLGHLLEVLRSDRPGWFVHWDGSRYATALGLPHTYATVEAFVRDAKDRDPETLMTAGAISLNTFRSDCFDHALADSLKDVSTYAHWFGLMKGLKTAGAPVHFTGRKTVIVRPQRPAPPDKELPADSDANWRRCLEWLRTEFNVPDLNPDLHSRLVSQDWLRQLTRHPWRTFRNNAALLAIPATWPRIFKRLRFLWKR